jgi:hypothetical protein
LFKRTIFKSCQPKEEAGSAGEQPASNRVDAYTVIREQSKKRAAFLLYYRLAFSAKKTHSLLFI